MQDVQDVPSFCWVARGCSSAPGLIARVSNKYPSKRILKSYLDMRTWFSGSTEWDDFPLGTTGYHWVPLGQVVKDDFLGAMEAQLQCSGLGLMAHPLTWMGNRPKGRSDMDPAIHRVLEGEWNHSKLVGFQGGTVNLPEV